MSKPTDWRDRAAAELAAKAVRRLRPSGRAALLVGERLTVPEEALRAESATVACWDRRAYAGRPATVRPSGGPFDLVLLRLPRSKAELEMTAHLLVPVLAPQAELLLYGAKDEGIGSSAKRLRDLFESADALEVGGHCRVWRMRLLADPLVPARTEPDDWAERFDPGLEGLPAEWVSYPGVFAHGGLDAGTRTLAAALPSGPTRSGSSATATDVGRVLDYGCGTGVLGALQRASRPDIQVDLLDIDAFAIEACRHNVPGARLWLGQGLAPVEGQVYDRIVTNPPIHVGKAETLEAVSDLIATAPALLSKRGSLWMVIQKRFSLRPVLENSFRDVTVRAEDAVFRVWEANGPIRAKGSR